MYPIRPSKPFRRGFTLVELLVVIAVTITLMAMILPAIQQAREASRRAMCQNNMKQLGLALHTYHDQMKIFPPESIWATPDGTHWQPRNYTWIDLILPMVDQSALYNQIDFTDAIWTQSLSDGQPIISRSLDVLRCPSDVGLDSPGEAHGMSITNYAGSEGLDWWTTQNMNRYPHGPPEGFPGGPIAFLPPGTNIQNRSQAGVFAFGHATRIRHIRDGAAQTIVLGEVTSNGFEGGSVYSSGTGQPRQSDFVFRSAMVSPTKDGDQTTPHPPVNQPYPQPDGNPSVPGNWFKSAPYSYKPTYVSLYGINTNWPGASSFHPGGANFVMADGSVKFINQHVDFWSVYHPLNTRDGGEVVNDPF